MDKEKDRRSTLFPNYYDSDSEFEYDYDGNKGKEEISHLGGLFDRYNILELTPKLTKFPKLVEDFRNVLKYLQSKDSDGFSDSVRRVLEDENFIKELYDECEDIFILNTIMYFGDLTQGRVDSTRERMTRIKNDRYYDESWIEGDDELVVRAGMSITLGYCTTGDDVDRTGLLNWATE